MFKSFLSSSLALTLVVPGMVLAQSIAPIQAITVTSSSSSAPARAVQAPTDDTKGGTEDINIGVGELQETPGVEPDEIDSKIQDDPEEGAVDVYIKIPDIDGESEEGRSIDPDEIDVNADPQEAHADYFMKIDTIEGESKDQKSSAAAKKGNVEYNWKVEEGESAQVPGVEPDEIDVAADPQPLTPDFGILLGGGGSDSDDQPTEESRAAIAEMLLQGLQEEGAPAETLSLNYEKIKTKLKQPVKFLGLFPMDISATVEIDAEEEVEVHFPWWSFLVTGKSEDALGELVFNTLSNVMKNKHDMMMNAIRNMK